jgi:hypothetical protein
MAWLQGISRHVAAHVVHIAVAPRSTECGRIHRPLRVGTASPPRDSRPTGPSRHDPRRGEHTHETPPARPPRPNQPTKATSPTARNVTKRAQPGTPGKPFERCDALTCGNVGDSAWWNNGGNPQRQFGHQETVNPQARRPGGRRVDHISRVLFARCGQRARRPSI